MGVTVLGGIDIVAIGIIALLLAFAAVLLFEWLTTTLSQIPTVGPWIASHLTPAAHAARSYLMGKIDAAITPLAAWMLVHHDRLAQWTFAVTHFANISFGTVGNIVGAQIPAVWKAITALPATITTQVQTAWSAALASEMVTVTNDLLGIRTDSRAWVTRAEQLAAADLDRAKAALHSKVNRVQAQAWRDVQAVKAGAASALGDAFGQVERDIAAAVSTAAAATTALQAHTVSLFGQAEHDIAAAIGTAAGDAAGLVDHAAAAAVAGTWTDLVDAAGGVAGEVSGDLADLKGLLGQIAGSVPVDLTGVLAALGVSSVAVLRYVERCGIPTCRNLGDVGRFLEALVGDVEQAGLIAFIILAHTDPKTAAREAYGALHTLIGPVVSVFDDLLKV